MKETGPTANPRPTNGNDVHVVPHSRGGAYRVFALAVSVAALALSLAIILHSPEPAPAPEPTQTSPQVADDPAAETDSGERPDRGHYIVRLSENRLSQRRASNDADMADPETPMEIPAGDYIELLREAGETEGLAAFSPPGTRPAKSGIVVPEDYELPEGFARHYQSTDDGKRLEAILTLAPGYEIVDEEGNSLAVGLERIVPPEAAPPDLPIRILDLPDAGNLATGGNR